MIRDVTEADLQGVRAFLEEHVDASLFLLSNLALNGPRAGEHPFSGTFRLAEEDGRIAAVFCLTRRGNLLVQAGGRDDLAQAILTACNDQPMAVCGIVGEWPIARALWRLLCADPGFEPAHGEHEVAKDALYGRTLTDADVIAPVGRYAIRLLGAHDFAQWEPLNAAYMTELRLPLNMTARQRRNEFDERARGRRWWGLLDAGELVAIGGLNAVYSRLGQIGGVYTRPDRRRLGLSGALLRVLMADCRALHRFERLALFTGEKNIAARAVYESLGFEYLGAFGLLLGSRRPGA